MFTGETFTVLDVAALGLFAVSWVGYGLIAELKAHIPLGLTLALEARRWHWLKPMPGRAVKIFDADLVVAFMRGVTIVALATTVLLLILFIVFADNFHILEEGRRMTPAARELKAAVEIRLALPILTLLYSYYRLAGAMREYTSYLKVLAGAKDLSKVGIEAAYQWVDHTDLTSDEGSRHFNAGLRAFFFGIAAAAWPAGPVVFILAILIVLGMLYWFEFHQD